MARNSSVNLDIGVNSDGYDISGGTTPRKLTVTGADMTLTGAGTNTYTFPSATDTLVGRTSTDTLTNKTLTTPTIGDMTNATHNHSNAAGGSTITILGTMTADIDMNSSYQITNLQAPAAAGEAIRQTTKITEVKMEAADDHVNDNTQAHSDYLLNSGSDSAVGPLTITADNSTADQAYVPMVLYNTDATPPTASGFPVGTIYVQYTA